ncbi:MAG: AMP-binding protein, partial [Pseudomonadota bacterium]|nr:AMP-binding protein [Pseudomonadota bacterium]
MTFDLRPLALDLRPMMSLEATMYIGDWLGKRELLTPDRRALVDDGTGRRYTYRQLNERANRLAHALRHRLGVRKGDRVAVLAKNRIEYLDALFATGKL